MQGHGSSSTPFIIPLGSVRMPAALPVGLGHGGHVCGHPKKNSPKRKEGERKKERII